DCRMRYTLSCATPLGLCLPPLYQGGGVALSYIHPALSPHRMRGEGGFSRVRGVPAQDVERKLLLATTLEDGIVPGNQRIHSLLPSLIDHPPIRRLQKQFAEKMRRTNFKA